MIDRIMKAILSACVKNDTLWHLFDKTFMTASRYAQRTRNAHTMPQTQPTIEQVIKEVCPDLVVKHGPFRGMRYPSATAYGSTLFPKLLGSYELELQPLIDRICLGPYSDVLDIGSAEGYYAVGLAMRLLDAKVYAFDVDTQAQGACIEMAKLNGVEGRLSVGGFCDADALRRFKFRGRGLVVSDCEGYEKKLFEGDVPQCLAQHDVLVEVHDFIDVEISTFIMRQFRETHSVEIVKSVDDIEKARTYSFEELDGVSMAQRRDLLAEKRPSIMEWLFFTPRQGHYVKDAP